MTSILIRVGCMPLFGLRSLPPLDPPLPFNPFISRPCNALPDCRDLTSCGDVDATCSAETPKLRCSTQADRHTTFLAPPLIEARAALLDCHHSSFNRFNAQPNARHQRRAIAFADKRLRDCASAACRCYVALSLETLLVLSERLSTSRAVAH